MWQYQVSVDLLTAALAADPRTRITGPLDAIDILARDDAGRAERIALQGQCENADGTRAGTDIRGDELRQVLTRAFGPRAIRSTRFDVRRTGADVHVLRHAAMATASASARPAPSPACAPAPQPADVLGYYYPGAVLRPGFGDSGLRGSGLGVLH